MTVVCTRVQKLRYSLNAALWQGCDEVVEAENSCRQLEAKRMAGECSLHSEVVDGVYIGL